MYNLHQPATVHRGHPTLLNRGTCSCRPRKQPRRASHRDTTREAATPSARQVRRPPRPAARELRSAASSTCLPPRAVANTEIHDEELQSGTVKVPRRRLHGGWVRRQRRRRRPIWQAESEVFTRNTGPWAREMLKLIDDASEEENGALRRRHRPRKAGLSPGAWHLIAATQLRLFLSWSSRVGRFHSKL